MSPFDVVPPKRPEITREAALILAEPYRKEDDNVFILGRTGYYRDTMGEPGKNDINIYDDAICLVTPTRCVPYNANTDPSRIIKGVAKLMSGRWLYKIGKHGLQTSNPYTALVQAAEVIVYRSEMVDYPKGHHGDLGYHMGGGEFKGWFGINHHKGGHTTTSSLGCQTTHPSQWGDYIEKVKATMAFYSLDRIPYILTEREDL